MQLFISREGKIFLTLSVNYPLFTSRMCSRVKRSRRKQVSYGISQNIKNVVYSNWIRPPPPHSVSVLLKDVGRYLARGRREYTSAKAATASAETGESNGQKNIYARSIREYSTMLVFFSRFRSRKNGKR